MTNDPKEWWKERCDGVFRGDQFDLVQDMMEESRSRFKEEAIRALEKGIHYEEGQIEDAVQERCGGAEGEIEESEIKIKALQDAIETIKNL